MPCSYSLLPLLFAAFSASAAAGIRIALPLLTISLLQGNVLAFIPLLHDIPLSVLLGVFTSLSLIELVITKNPIGQRVLQPIQLLFSPVVGAILAIAYTDRSSLLVWITGFGGGLLALLFQLVQASWLYRFRVLPLSFLFAQDALCVTLIVLAIYAPLIGGLITFILLWFSVRSYQEWQRQKHQRR